MYRATPLSQKKTAKGLTTQSVLVAQSQELVRSVESRAVQDGCLLFGQNPRPESESDSAF